MKTTSTFFGILALALVLTGPLQARAQDYEAYQKGYEEILDSNWSQAESTFSEFMSRFKTSEWADDAQFWLCYVRDKIGQDAERVFGCYKSFVDAYPNSSWSDDARASLVRIGQQLVRAGKPEYRALIRSFQSNDDEEVALAALYALQNIDDDRALPTILELYDRTDNATLRDKIVYVLGNFDDPKVVDKLREIALSGESTSVRKSAVNALGNRDDQAAAGALRQVAQSDAPTEVRKAALYAMGNMDLPDLARILREVAVRGNNEELGKAAAYAMGNMDTDAAAAGLRDIVQSDASTEVRKAALYAMGNMDLPDLVPALRDIARTSDNTELGASWPTSARMSASPYGSPRCCTTSATTPSRMRSRRPVSRITRHSVPHGFGPEHSARCCGARVATP
jgi:outer membrane protein assembly factor BamD (BamD/ComL family)